MSADSSRFAPGSGGVGAVPMRVRLRDKVLWVLLI